MVFSEDLIKMFDICLFLAQKIEEDRESAFKAINKFAKLTKDTKQKNSDLKAEIKRLEEQKINDNEEAFNMEMIQNNNVELISENKNL